MEEESIRALPIYNFVRIAYCFITLIKIYLSTKTPGSHIGAAINRDILKLDFYLQSLIDKSIEAVQPKEYRAPYTFLGMLIRLQTWLKSQESDKVFSPPQLTGFDDCWLPPVPVSQSAKETTAEALNPQGSNICQRPTDAVHGDGLRSQNEQVNLDQHTSMATAGPPLRFDELEALFNSQNASNELDVDHLMSLGGIEGFDGEDYNWMSDLNMGATFDFDPAPSVSSGNFAEAANPNP